MQSLYRDNIKGFEVLRSSNLFYLQKSFHLLYFIMQRIYMRTSNFNQVCRPDPTARLVVPFIRKQMEHKGWDVEELARRAELSIEKVEALVEREEQPFSNGGQQSRRLANALGFLNFPALIETAVRAIPPQSPRETGLNVPDELLRQGLIL
jgi:hypothetical protein